MPTYVFYGNFAYL